MVDSKLRKNQLGKLKSSVKVQIRRYTFLLSKVVVRNLFFYLAAHLMPIFFSRHTLSPPKNFCGTLTLYITGKIWEKTHYNSLFYNLAAHLEVTRGTLLCPVTVVENHCSKSWPLSIANSLMANGTFHFKCSILW